MTENLIDHAGPVSDHANPVIDHQALSGLISPSMIDAVSADADSASADGGSASTDAGHLSDLKPKRSSLRSKLEATCEAKANITKLPELSAPKR